MRVAMQLEKGAREKGGNESRTTRSEVNYTRSWKVIKHLQLCCMPVGPCVVRCRTVVYTTARRAVDRQLRVADVRIADVPLSTGVLGVINCVIFFASLVSVPSLLVPRTYWIG